MLRTIGVISILLLSRALLASGFDARVSPYSGPRAVAVFTPITNADTSKHAGMPHVVVYENGDVIFLKKVGNTATYRIGHADESTMKTFHGLVVAALEEGVPKDYDDMPHSVDAPMESFYVRDGRRERSLTAADVWEGAPHDQLAKMMPKTWLALRDTLVHYQPPDDKPWSAAFIKVDMMPFDVAREARPWPADWPGPTSARTIPTKIGYAVFLDGKDAARLDAFLACTVAVAFGSKKMIAVSSEVLPAQGDWERLMRPWK